MSAMDLSATVLLAGCFAWLLTILALQVSLRRVTLGGVNFGDAGDEILIRRIRAHGNFTEYAPTALLVVFCLDVVAADDWVTWTASLSFLATRIVHAIAILYCSNPALRASAMIVQHLTFVAAGSYLLLVVLRQD